MQQSCDVLIIGGGLSGLTLAIQLKRKNKQLTILVVEKSVHPAPHAAHKVGESSVEIASHYFEKILGLTSQLENELPKLGLRFFYTQGDNSNITRRIELGPNNFPAAKSYQLDRGNFENALAEECIRLGINFQDNCQVKKITLGKNKHQIRLIQQEQTSLVQAKWLIDASGRMSLLKRKLKLTKPAYHDVNASWFRINHKIKVDDWSTDKSWQMRVKASRHLSTNHLMGHGYWVWLIPLSSGATSIGIVADAKIHPYAEFNTFERARNWLKTFEPQCAARVEQHIAQFQDFLSLKHYSHHCKQMYSADGWAITGDAGVFLDPFYSPGSDFIALNNGFITDLIDKHYAGEEVTELTKQHEKLFRTLFLAFRPVYEDQYPIMENAKVMSVKIIWDYTLYWGSVALLFFRDKFIDVAFMQIASPLLQQIYQINVQMQGFFRQWAELDISSQQLHDVFINYSKIKFLQQLNRDLLKQQTEQEVQQQLVKNIELIQQVSNEIISEAVNTCPELQVNAPEIISITSSYLDDVFILFKPV